MKSAALALVLAAALPVSAANIYIISSTDSATDNAAALALTSRGHTVTIGVNYTAFDGSQSLAGFQTVYLQANYDWTSGVMPAAGQAQLVSFVTTGGRLVTSEWVDYYSATNFSGLEAILPLQQIYSYGNLTSTTYQVVTADATINAGVPSSLTFPLSDYAGTETFAVTQTGATTYYSSSSSPGIAGLAGWAQGAGSVFSFTSTCGPDQVADSNFGRLFSNVMGATSVINCYANCDGSTSAPILNVADFTCFLQKFAAQDPYANCDHSTSAPTLNVADFTCFLQKFAAGCP